MFQLLVISALLPSAISTTAFDEEQQAYIDLKGKLLEGYEVSLLPWPVEGGPVRVNLKLAINQLVVFDITREVATVSTWLTMAWTDRHLVWNPANWHNVSEVRVHPDAIWTPDIRLFNSISDEPSNENDFYNMAVVTFDGRVLIREPRLYNFRCPVFVMMFPFDEQSCKLEFGPWTYAQNEVTVESNTREAGFHENGEWTLRSFETSDKSYEADHLMWSKSEFVMQLSRNFEFYVLNILVPTMLIACMSLLIFMLPAEGGNKIEFGTTIFLTLVVNNLVIADYVPPISNEIPLVTKFNCAVMIMVAASLFAAVLISRFTTTIANTPPLPRVLKTFVRQFGRFLFVKGLSEDVKDNLVLPVSRRGTLVDSNGTVSHCGPQEMMLESTTVDSPLEEKMEHPLGRELNKIIVHLDHISATMGQESFERDNENDWLKLAELLDKIFALCFLIVLLVISVIFVKNAHFGAFP